MFGCERLAAAWASRRKRSTNERSTESSGKSTLSATGRSSNWSRARYTSAMPPRATRCESSYRPESTRGVLVGSMRVRAYVSPERRLGQALSVSSSGATGGTSLSLSRQGRLDHRLHHRSGDLGTSSRKGLVRDNDDDGHLWLGRRGEGDHPVSGGAVSHPHLGRTGLGRHIL